VRNPSGQLLLQLAQRDYSRIFRRLPPPRRVTPTTNGLFCAELRKSTVALATKEANEQHYEVPADFYEFCLGHRRKYSSGYWPKGVDTLDASEDAAFDLLAKRAELQDGQRILDLGCGWGSFTLWALERFPKAKVTCISNSFSQAKHIKARAEAMGAAHRLTAVTADVNVFQTDKDAFDRVVSIEMFEHVRNYETLLARVRTWLKPGGKLFVHVFSHKTTPWFYDEGWMAENFFTNGQMPSDDLFLHFQKDLTVKDKWFMDGTHYARTCEAWLAKMDAHTPTVRQLMSEAYQFPGPDSAETTKKLVDWRLFYLACAEMFAYKNGEEWGVSHYVFERTH